jgi:hypothetical protein
VLAYKLQAAPQKGAGKVDTCIANLNFALSSMLLKQNSTGSASEGCFNKPNCFSSLNFVANLNFKLYLTNKI